MILSFVDELPVAKRALEFATAHHTGQQRASDGAPYVLHPLEVASHLDAHGYGDRVVAAGLLHDVLERTRVTFADLEHEFGTEIALLVRVVSEPSGEEGYAERKARLRAEVARANGEAAAVFAADKLARAHEVRLELARGRRADPERIQHYWASMLVAEQRLGRTPLVRELRFGLEALALLPPGLR
jgi:(p)ppGpp synthase/HD superfamily hydrolase